MWLWRYSNPSVTNKNIRELCLVAHVSVSYYCLRESVLACQHKQHRGSVGSVSTMLSVLRCWLLFPHLEIYLNNTLLRLDIRMVLVDKESIVIWLLDVEESVMD